MTKLTLAPNRDSVPRYTSYPTAPHFYPIAEGVAEEKLRLFAKSDRPLSIYMHIPFCRSMCLFCGCSVLLNRRPETVSSYVDLLIQEIGLVRGVLQKKRRVAQIHLGGGTPTSLSIADFRKLFGVLREAFELEELSIEVDPRGVFADKGEQLTALRELGFYRASFGVQDLDPAVQEVVRRRQSEEMSRFAYQKARELGFSEINLDLIYGLPLQTPERFSETAREIAAWRPDRIALFGYAHVPWMKAHQKALPEDHIPNLEGRQKLYAVAQERFLQAGYEQIGMDHFALPGDSLARAARERTLVRNFQGYSPYYSDDLLGLGVTSVGHIADCYLQNVKTVEEYRDRLQKGILPTFRGFDLKPDDLRRRWTVHRLMCQFILDKQLFYAIFGDHFDDYFTSEQEGLQDLETAGWLQVTREAVKVLELGQPWVRLIASRFDAHLSAGTAKYSRI